MPRYFFNLHYQRPSFDTVGEDLPDDAAAWHEATMIAGELFRDVDGRFRPGHEWRLEVTDERRNPIYVLRITGEEI